MCRDPLFAYNEIWTTYVETQSTWLKTACKAYRFDIMKLLLREFDATADHLAVSKGEC